jgi:hypothetical protein
MVWWNTIDVSEECVASIFKLISSYNANVEEASSIIKCRKSSGIQEQR